MDTYQRCPMEEREGMLFLFWVSFVNHSLLLMSYTKLSWSHYYRANERFNVHGELSHKPSLRFKTNVLSSSYRRKHRVSSLDDTRSSGIDLPAFGQVDVCVLIERIMIYLLPSCTSSNKWYAENKKFSKKSQSLKSQSPNF